MAASPPFVKAAQAIGGVDASAATSELFVLECRLNNDASMLAASMSNRVVRMYDPKTLRSVGSLQLPHGKDVVRSLEWSESTPSVLLVATSTPDEYAPFRKGESAGSGGGKQKGAGAAGGGKSDTSSLLLYDARVGKTVDSLNVGAERFSRGELGSAALSGSGTMMAASFGASIGFFDLRTGLSTAKPVGLYTDSHSEHVTQLQFHPVLQGHLLSGGEDGLVCAFDTRVAGETDALVSVLAAGDAVSRFGVFGPHGAFVHVLTRTDSLSVWNLGTAERMAGFPSLRPSFMESGLDADCLISCAWDEGSNGLTLLAGGEEGALHLFDVGPSSIALRGSMRGGHTAAIRTAAWSRVGAAGAAGAGMLSGFGAGMDGSSSGSPGPAGTVLYTGGEDGKIVQWVDGVAAGVLGGGAVPGAAAGSAAGGGGKKGSRWRREGAYVRRSGASTAAAAGGGSSPAAAVVDDDEVALFGTRVMRAEAMQDEKEERGAGGHGKGGRDSSKLRDAPF